MNVFFLNTALAVSWAALAGSFTLASLAVGFVIGYAALWAARPLLSETAYFERVFRILQLLFMFVFELFVSSLRVVWDVVTPTHRSRPGVVAVPLDVKGEAQILTLANLISLTPGSLSLDVSPDHKTLYVHAMFVDDPDAFVRRIKDGVEQRVIRAFS